MWFKITSESKVHIGAVVKDSHNGETMLEDDDGKVNALSIRSICLSIHS